ncbi:glycoside hydrolase family 99-like domain-containing protein [Pseudoxanthomonas koreensis]|uniref:glycoside hydrolase family 99-like domain-containing protein n=1 Tax=Pseudoxanthomonas koreensis TaxID=266061 RepID=UPI0013914066|nr:hypothetical protein CSC64_08595 [Pseudoxanthomonas koreensis]
MSVPMGERFRNALFDGLRFGFRLLPLSEGTRDRWRQRFLGRFPDLQPAPVRGQVGTHASTRRARMRADQPAIGHVPWRREALPSPLPATLVAFYLPQFHPIPENDAWWGKGFTEWRNVARALPQFEGHAQPRLPADLGWYDLRNPDTMREQARLAREYGIGAFCFYFYWFGGKTLLESPLEQWLADPTIDMPLCLCWANENWSRRWDGREQDILIGQRHDAGDDLAFIAHVARYLRDPRYLRVDGKPLLLVYRPGLLPDAKATALRWRHWCHENGVGEIVLAYVQGFERPDPRGIGFDAAVEFPPNMGAPADITGEQQLLNKDFRGSVLDWRMLADDYRQRPLPDYRLFPGVDCGWDNEPRRPGLGRVYLHASPRRYRDWLRDTVHQRLAQAPASDRLVFVNAWNEWAEGAVLEPDARLGHAWLQATRDALRDPDASPVPVARPCLVVHAWYPEVLGEILAAMRDSGQEFRLLATTSPDKVAAVRAVLQQHGVHGEVVECENRGRDILPFLHLASHLLDEGESIVLKLHTKQSLHRRDGETWRRELLDLLLPQGRAADLAAAFANDPTLGLLAPEGHVQPMHYYWGANEDNVRYLATRTGIGQPQTDRDRFIAGSMFWARLEALRPLLDAHLDDWEFEPEQGQVDGTFAHALERMFVLAADNAGYRTITTAELDGRPGADRRYPYADRG